MRCIDADALIECLQTWKTVAVSEGLPINERFAMAMIAQVNLMPTIEPERKKGKWIRHPEQRNIYGGKCVECSECGEKYMVQYIEDEKYCRNCGADMREEGEET